MRRYKREKYKLESYEDEQFALHYWEEKGEKAIIEHVEYDKYWEKLYAKAKKLAEEKGWKAEIWELKYSFCQ